MNVLEQKVDALIRLNLAASVEDRVHYRNVLAGLMTGKKAVGTVREEADAMLTELGVSPHLMGYAFALEAICITVEDPKATTHGNIYSLWSKTADICSASPRNVERCIRHAVERCFDNCDPDLITRYFGYTVSMESGKLTCGEFVAGCARIIRKKVYGK